MTRPIRPDEVEAARAKTLPPQVFDVFNAMIVAAWNGHEAKFKMAEVAKEIGNALALPTHRVFELHYLDVESVYRDVGWDVVYDAPGYNETYEATFRFRKKK